MEDFNLEGLTLDEAAEARIAHAAFLEAIRDWGIKMGNIMQPYTSVAQVLMDENRTEQELIEIAQVFPIGLRISIEHVNSLYEMIQREAVKVLGQPFAIHEEHHPGCDGTGNNCGHQDHYKE